MVGREAFDSAVCTDAGFSDIDKDKVKRFLQIARNQRNFPLDLDTPVKDVLIHLNLLKSGKLTNAALLLFWKNPNKFFLQAEAKCIQFPGTEVEKPFTSYHSSAIRSSLSCQLHTEGRLRHSGDDQAVQKSGSAGA